MEEKRTQVRVVYVFLLALLLVGLFLGVGAVTRVVPGLFFQFGLGNTAVLALCLVGIPVIYLLWVSVTDLRTENEQIVRYDKIFSTALEHSDIAVMITNAGLRGSSIKIQYVNHAWESLFGWSAAEVVGLENPHILNSGRQTKEYYNEMWETLSRNQVFKSHVVDRCKDGRLVEIDTTIIPVMNQRHTEYFVAILRDVTDRMNEQIATKKRQSELERVNELMVDRELRMKELKTEIQELKKQKS